MLVQIAVVALLFPATFACLFVVVPAFVGLFSPRQRPGRPTHAFAIVIPAHNEQLTLPATLQSLAVLDYPPELVRVFVVADHCTDHTAKVARWGSAVCLARSNAGKCGKDSAVRFGLENIGRELPDIVIILDAGCRLHPNALLELDARFSQGADAVQCTVRSENTADAPTGYVAAVQATLDRGRARGLERLGSSVPLRGTGMAFRRALLHRIPWTSAQEYARSLRQAHVQVRHCGEAIVWSKSARVLEENERNRRGLLLSGRAMFLPYLSVATALSIASGQVIWPIALALLTALAYFRAMWLVAMERSRMRCKMRSPGMVVRLGGSIQTGMMRREPMHREPIARDGERQAAK